MTRIDLLTNPMTTAEDIIVGGASGAPSRLAVGSNGNVLTVSAGSVAWASPSAATDANVFIGTIPPWLCKDTMSTGGSNTAIFMRFKVDVAKSVSTAYFNLSVSSGNLDIGIYDASLNRLGSTGSFASPGTGQRNRALTGSVALSAGTIYYAAVAADNTTIRITGIVAASGLSPAGGGWNLAGSKASAFALPDPISTPTWDATQALCPCIIFN